ncbi:PepSY domain-containing protein [Bosea sp. (in: a-proteobacteria)]|uniref:PepSY domain-containing protein n=1 Tax=Bosea sp. (in: a-proteobacteria) TaxID=1871050 RepID=UPI002FC62EA7
MSRTKLLAAAIVAALMAGGALAASTEPPEATLAAMGKISEARARAIAFDHGLVHVEEISLFEGRWELAGRDRSGDELVIDLNARDGSLLR